MPTGDRAAVLVAAAGAAWESDALRELAGAGVVVAKRCVDLPDLLASAAAGRADVALVAADLPGLDGSAVLLLLRHDVRTVAVGDHTRSQLARIGVVGVVSEQEVTGSSVVLADVLRRAAVQELVADPDPDVEELTRTDRDVPEGRVVAVWGPAGAPGRTTVAVGLAAELARRGRRTLLADLDPYGGSVAQQLGVLDEVSGLLAAARLTNAGELDLVRFAGTRRVAGEGLELLTGLPRADRWVEVRDGVVGEILELASGFAHVVADTGFNLEDPEADFGRPGAGRNRMTLESLAVADEVVVVGAADPVGLSRLARGLVDLGDTCPGVPVRVVVNRMRDSLGWAEPDIRGMVEGFARPLGTHFLPDDRAACDRALVAGRTLVETGDSPLRRELSGLVDLMFPETLAVAGPGRRRRRRWAGSGQAPNSR